MITLYSIEYWDPEHLFYFIKILHFILIALIFFRSIQSLEASKTFGPLIGALYFIVLECAKFCVVFALVVTLFSYIAFILFYKLENGRFRTWSQSVLYRFLSKNIFTNKRNADYRIAKTVADNPHLNCMQYDLQRRIDHEWLDR